MSKFLRNLVEEFKDEDTSIAEDGAGSAEFTGSIDSGSYSLNAALSGSIFGGVPNNKITAFAGESATGKTFFVLGIVKSFLDSNPLNPEVWRYQFYEIMAQLPAQCPLLFQYYLIRSCYQYYLENDVWSSPI